MQIQFLGATGTVTGSRYLLTDGTFKVLVDCGLFQGPKAIRDRNWAAFPIDPAHIDAVILTHAHIDHSGYLPLLVKQGFRGPIFCSEATYDLCKILLLDSGHLHEEDARYAAKHGYSKHNPPLPLYTSADAEACLKYFRIQPYGTPFVVVGDHNGLSASLHHAGHILGASFVYCYYQNRRILFSGDIGRPKDPIMNPPAKLQKADYLIIESTYGDRRHPTVNPITELRSIVTPTLRRGGTVLIPAFAVGRSQSLLYYFDELRKTGQMPSVPIYLDSPMAVETTALLCKYANEHHLSAHRCSAVSQRAILCKTVDDSKIISHNPVPKIVISASGMLSGGRAVHHLKNLISDDRNTIVLAGFQAPETLGARLLEKPLSIKIHGEYFPVRAQISQLTNTSAHADYAEILAWLRHFDRPPTMTFITHGESHSAEAMKGHIESTLNWPCRVPEYLETVSL